MFKLLIDYSSYGAAWNAFTQIGILIVAVLVGNILRVKIPFFRKALIPSSLIGGMILLLLKFIPAFREFIDNDIMSLVTYHAIGLSFAAMALKTTKKGTATKEGVINNGFLQGGVYIGQAALGIGCCLVLYLFTKNSSNPVLPCIGAILSLGFAQGPGNAMIYSEAYLNGNRSFGLAIATIGFIVASVVGITYMNILRKKGKLIIRELPQGDLRKVSDYEGENEIPPTESVDKLTIQLALLLVSYAMAYGVMYGLNICFKNLSKVIGISINFSFGFNFLWGALCAYLLKFILVFLKKKNVIKREYTNNYLIDRISGLLFDLMVAAGVCSIDFNEVKGLVLPLVVLSIAGTIFTFFYIRAVTKECFKGYENEAFLANFGTLTGQLGNGMILLREVDPTYQTPASYNLILLQLPLLVVLLPELLLLDFNGSSVNASIITFIVWTIVFIIYTVILFRKRIFKKHYSKKTK